MTSLIKKNVNGHIYWYAVKCNRVNGKPRIVSQIYLGTAERITQVMTESGGRIPKIKSYPFGLPAALLLTAKDLKWIEIVSSHVKKKQVKGPSVGEFYSSLVWAERAVQTDVH